MSNEVEKSQLYAPDHAQPHAQGQFERAGRTRSKRLGLLLLALLTIGAAFWPGMGADRQVRAQDPISPFETPTITPTLGPTPTKVKRVINEIRHPQAGDAVAGVTPIIGTALIDLFNRYDVHIAVAGSESWQWLTTNFQVIHDDVLYRWVTNDFPDGFYDLRIRAIDDGGNYSESFLRGVEVRNAAPPTLTPDPSGLAAPVSPLSLPTLTPTPDPQREFLGGQGFYAPDAGAVVRGQTTLAATVTGLPLNPFRRFELSFARAGTEDWQWLYGAQHQAWQEPIFVWDTTTVADGLYDLRLRIVYKDSNYSEYLLRNLSVANQSAPVLAFAPPAGISAPRSGATAQGVVEFRGSVPEADLLRWELAWSPGESDQWQLLVTSDSAVGNGVLARLDLSRLPAGVYDFRLRVIRSDTNYTDYFVRGLRLLPD
jgi:hypothetical protein